MMQRLNLFFTVSLVSLLAISEGCKTSRPTVEIQETPYSPPSRPGTTPPSPLTDDIPTATLKVSSLSLPASPKGYSRLSITLSTGGKIIEDNENYSLNEALPLMAFKTYTLIVRAYDATDMVYSNEFCSSGKDFKSKPGLNTYKVPVCAVPSAEEQLADREKDKEEAEGEKSSSETETEQAPVDSGMEDMQGEGEGRSEGSATPDTQMKAIPIP